MRFKETLHERSLPVGRVFPNLPTVCVWNGRPARIRYVDVKNRGRSYGDSLLLGSFVLVSER